MVTHSPSEFPYQGRLKPVDEGAEIKAEALVVGGRVVPIETAPPGSLGFQSKTRKHKLLGMDKAIRGLSLV